MKMGFLVSITSGSMPRIDVSTPPCTWGPLTLWCAPGGSVHSLAFDPHPHLSWGILLGFAWSGEKLEACPVLANYNVLLHMVCSYQQTVSIHFGG